MKSEQVRTDRRAMLLLPHIAPLASFAADLRSRHGVEVPDFDPMDSGIHARMLFLKEKPGPLTSASRPGRVESGFISRDNDDPTAESTFLFMEAAGIRRQDTVMWNVAPGWNDTRKITRHEFAAGAAEVRNLMALLPNVEVVVLFGKKAAKAEPLFAGTGVAIFHSAHYSPLVRASKPAEWAKIPEAGADAARALR